MAPTSTPRTTDRGRTPLYLVEYGNANAPSESTADLLRALGAREPVVEQ